MPKYEWWRRRRYELQPTWQKCDNNNSRCIKSKRTHCQEHFYLASKSRSHDVLLRPYLSNTYVFSLLNIYMPWLVTRQRLTMRKCAPNTHSGFEPVWSILHLTQLCWICLKSWVGKSLVPTKFWNLVISLEIETLKENSHLILNLDSQICCENSHSQFSFSTLILKRSKIVSN